MHVFSYAPCAVEYSCRMCLALRAFRVCIIWRRYDAWNFPSPWLCHSGHTPQWMNALTVVAVVVTISLKHIGVAGSHFRFFCTCDLDLDPMTFIYELDPYSFELHRMSDYIKAFEGYCLTDRHTDVIHTYRHTTLKLYSQKSQNSTRGGIWRAYPLAADVNYGCAVIHSCIQTLAHRCNFFLSINADNNDNVQKYCQQHYWHCDMLADSNVTLKLTVTITYRSIVNSITDTVTCSLTVMWHSSWQ